MMLCVLVIFLGTPYLRKISSPAVAPKTHSAFMVRNERLMGTNQRILIDNSKKESEYLFLRIGSRNAMGIEGSDSNVGFVRSPAWRHERKYRYLIGTVDWWGRKIFDAINEHCAASKRNDLGGGISKIRGFESKNPTVIVCTKK